MRTEVKHPNGRKIRSDSKYQEKFTKQLLSGIRFKEGLSIVELCRQWRVTVATYYSWIDKYADFKEAHEQGEVDFAAWWMKTYKDITTGDLKGNAGCAIFGVTNVKHINWSSKVDVNSTSTEQVKTLQIEVLPSKETRIIEHEPDLIEAKPSDE